MQPERSGLDHESIAKGATVKQGRDLTDAGQTTVTEWIRSIR